MLPRTAELRRRAALLRKTRRIKASPAHTVITGVGPLSPVCYASSGKRRSREVLMKVAQGNGWSLQMHAAHDPRRLAVFYGVTADTLETLRTARRSSGQWLYIDNAYFGRGEYYRVTLNAVQHTGLGDTTGERWRRLGLPIAPWRNGGRHILVCPQSELWHAWFMSDTPQAWSARITAELRRYTDRPVVIRYKPDIARERVADAVAEANRQLAEALEDCHAVVVYQSGVGVQAALAGVPVFALGPGAVSPVACHDLSQIEQPLRPDDRERWAGVLADNQWTMAEISAGALRKRYGPR